MASNKKKRQEIMDCMDWEKIQNVMTYLDWKWFDGGVPTRARLQRCAEDLLLVAHHDAKEQQETCTICTGGFRATAHYYEGKVCGYDLKFVLTEWDAFDE